MNDTFVNAFVSELEKLSRAGALPRYKSGLSGQRKLKYSLGMSAGAVPGAAKSMGQPVGTRVTGKDILKTLPAGMRESAAREIAARPLPTSRELVGASRRIATRRPQDQPKIRASA